MKNILTLFLCLFFIYSFSQVENKNSKDYITLDLVSPFYLNSKQYNTPRWNVGFIKNISDHSKIGLSLGYGNKASSILTTGEDYSLFEIRPEYYYILDPQKKTLKYISLEFIYISQTETLLDNYFFTESNLFTNYDKADYTRVKWAIVPKYGMFIHFSEHIGMNIYIGLGVRSRTNTFKNIEGENIVDDEGGHFPPYYRYEGERIGVEFSMGLKLLYRI